MAVAVVVVAAAATAVVTALALKSVYNEGVTGIYIIRTIRVLPFKNISLASLYLSEMKIYLGNL